MLWHVLYYTYNAVKKIAKPDAQSYGVYFLSFEGAARVFKRLQPSRGDEFQNYPNGVEILDTPSINKGTVDELAKVHYVDRSLAKRIVSLRGAVGKICKESDLRKLKGITDEQVWWLTQFTRA